MNTKNKLKKKSMKIIITMMLAVVFLIGEILSPFSTLAYAGSTYVEAIVVDGEGNPIEGAHITFQHNAGGGWKSEPVARTSDSDGYLGGNLDLGNGRTKIFADGYDTCTSNWHDMEADGSFVPSSGQIKHLKAPDLRNLIQPEEGVLYIILTKSNINTPPIKILEIEPGDLFKLTFTNAKSIDPLKDNYTNYTNKNIMPKSEQSKVVVNGKETNVTIDHITMPELVSKIDDIDGAYDVVIIGRENVESTGPNDGDRVNGLSSYRLKDQYNLKYRDYTNPFYEEIVNNDSNKNTKIFKNSGVISDSAEKEYFSENDITKKRMKEIEKIVGKNQLVYMDKKIGRGEDYKQKIDYKVEDKGITKTNLFSLYNEFGDDKVKKFDNLNINDIVTQYNNISGDYKRPEVYSTIGPSGNADSPYEVNNGKVTFGFTTNNIKKENLKVKIYIDNDGNGLFDENECKVIDNLACEIGKNNYTKEYVVGEDFFGYLAWKIEVINDKGIENNIIDSCVVKKKDSSSNKKEIKVLQVMSSNDYKPSESWVNPDQVGEPWYGASDFKYNSKFKNLCDQTGYNINVRVVSSGYVNDNPNILQDYDTIIFRIWWEEDCEFSDKVLQDIKELSAKNKNIIFTRESISAYVLKTSGKISNLTQKFRDYAGLARYKDPYRLENGVINESDIDGSKIPHNDTNNGTYSAGISTSHITEDFQSSSLAQRINSNKITQYPFNLEKTNINIRPESHTQAFQLNLEDDDVVPLYNFSITGTEVGDSCNFYYAYSKGNISYCATEGDGNGNYTEDELKLFINMIVNKQNNSNSQPVIKSKYTENNVEKDILNNQVINLQSISENFNFTTQATDADGDKVKFEVYLDNGQTPYTTSNGLQPQGTIIPISIPSSKLTEVFSRENKNLNIRVVATDEKGAITEESFTIHLCSIVDITYGLYTGMGNGQVDISDISDKTFANDSAVTLASNLNPIDINNNKYIKLEIDDNITLVSSENPVIYLFKNGKQVGKDTMQGSGHDFNYNVENSYDNIAIVYSVKLPNTQEQNKSYKNTISVLNSQQELIKSKEVIIKNDILPDLF